MEMPPFSSKDSGWNSPQSEVFNRLLQDRIVVLGSEVEDNVANLITAQLLYLEAQDDTKDIWLYINSPGGVITSGMAIYDTMQFIKPDVATVCMGLAASMGQFLLCAGTPGKRYALPHSRVLMHQPSAQMQGAAVDIAIHAEQIVYTKRIMAERIAQHTGQKVEQIELDFDRDRWFTAEEAKAYGIIDHVISKAAQVAA
jgi:ATP-dependent Clp protease protease subunit